MKRLIDGNDLAAKFRARKTFAYGDHAAQDLWELAMYDAINADEVTLNDLRDEVYEDAVAHGLWEDVDKEVQYEIDSCDYPENWRESMYRSYGAHLILDEAVEMDVAWKNSEKYIEELADVIIMCMSVAGKLGIDIDAAVRNKMRINRRRPWKHGKEQREDTKAEGK